jgi:glycerol-3-phosphate acyltransferase PlsY
MWLLSGFLVLTYLLCSVPFGLLIGKLWAGIDVREHGSRNIGATNVWRVIGPVPGIIALLCDAGKALVPVLLAKKYLILPFLPAGSGEVLVCIMAVMGHTYSVFLKFKGGKGVATSLGIFLALDYRIALIGLGLFIVIVFITRYISLGSIIGMSCSPLLVIVFYRSKPEFYAYFFLTVLSAVLVIYSHRANIKRLLAGTESKFGKKISKENNLNA